MRSAQVHGDGADGHTGRVTSMDLASKVRLLTGLSWFTFGSEPSIGLAGLRMCPTARLGCEGSSFAGVGRCCCSPVLRCWRQRVREFGK